MPDSNRVAVCISETGYAEYFHSYDLLPYKLEIMAFLQCQSLGIQNHRIQGLTLMSAFTTATSTHSTEPGDNQ